MPEPSRPISGEDGQDHAPADYEPPLDQGHGDSERVTLESWICPRHGLVAEFDLLEGQDPALGTPDDPDGWTDTYYCGLDDNQQPCGREAQFVKLIPASSLADLEAWCREEATRCYRSARNCRDAWTVDGLKVEARAYATVADRIHSLTEGGSDE